MRAAPGPAVPYMENLRSTAGQRTKGSAPQIWWSSKRRAAYAKHLSPCKCASLRPNPVSADGLFHSPGSSLSSLFPRRGGPRPTTTGKWRMGPNEAELENDDVRRYHMSSPTVDPFCWRLPSIILCQACKRGGRSRSSNSHRFSCYSSLLHRSPASYPVTFARVGTVQGGIR